MNAPSARPRVEWRVVDGLLLLDKPAGLSSNRALQQVRRLFRAHKAGHTGSLDPFATGMLPLCFGQATKVAGLLLEAPKAYRATLALGTRTASGDTEGAVLESRPVPPLDAAAVEAALKRFRGEQQQVPPMYSALKRDGEPLYRLARRGLEVERAPRRVRIIELELERLEPGTLEFRVRCSKGTYVRTLGEDIAAALGTVGHLVALRRTEFGALDAPALPIERLEALAGNEAALDALLLPVDSALGHHPRVELEAGHAARFLHGAGVPLRLAPPDAQAGQLLRVYDETGRFLGLGAYDALALSLEPRRVMCGADA